MATFSSNSDEEKGIDMGDLVQELDQDEFDAPTTLNGGNIFRIDLWEWEAVMCVLFFLCSRPTINCPS